MNKKERLYYFIAKHCKRRRWQRYFEKRIAKCCKISGYNGFAYSEAIRIFYKEVHGLEIGYGCFGDCWCNPSLWWKDIKIGRYCSFAQNLYIATANHPLDMFTTHPVAYCQEYGAKTSDFDIRSHGLEIGHGVWIGQSVLIMPGCFKIGNGAIVGGGSVVTHNVPPYAIVAGNPARIIRYRFDKDTCAKIDSMQWWIYDKDYVSEHTTEWNAIIKNDD